MATTQYDLQHRVEIGRGAFGKVYKVKDKVNNKFVAVKALTNFQSTKDEVNLLKQCKSPFIVEFIGILEQDFSTLIIMEYCANGSLMNILQGRKSMNEIEIHKIMKDILNGLDFLHNTIHILHRDIKPDNILLGNDLNYKLSDFGVSKDVSISTAKTKCGTPLYMAPELHQFKKYDSKCDIYSVGVTSLHLFVYSDPKIMKDIAKIQKFKKNINLLQTTNDNFKKFIAKCIVNNSAKRTSVEQLLKYDEFINDGNKRNDDEKQNYSKPQSKYHDSNKSSLSKKKSKEKYHPEPVEYFHPGKAKIISYHPQAKQMRHIKETYHPSPEELYHPGNIDYCGNSARPDRDDGWNYTKINADWTCCRTQVWIHDEMYGTMRKLNNGCVRRRDCCDRNNEDFWGGCTWACCNRKVKDGYDQTACQMSFGCCNNVVSQPGCKTKQIYSCCNNNKTDGCQQRYLCCGKPKNTDGCIRKKFIQSNSSDYNDNDANTNEEQMNEKQKEFRKWIYDELDLSQYYNLFVENGFDDIEVVQLLGDNGLKALGVDRKGSRMKLLLYSKDESSQKNVETQNKNGSGIDSIDECFTAVIGK
eukprot:209124_1